MHNTVSAILNKSFPFWRTVSGKANSPKCLGGNTGSIILVCCYMQYTLVWELHKTQKCNTWNKSGTIIINNGYLRCKDPVRLLSRDTILMSAVLLRGIGSISINIIYLPNILCIYNRMSYLVGRYFYGVRTAGMLNLIKRITYNTRIVSHLLFGNHRFTVWTVSFGVKIKQNLDSSRSNIFVWI